MPAGASMSEPVFAMVLVVLAVASLLPLDEPGLAGAPRAPRSDGLPRLHLDHGTVCGQRHFGAVGGGEIQPLIAVRACVQRFAGINLRGGQHGPPLFGVHVGNAVVNRFSAPSGTTAALPVAEVGLNP